MQGANLPTRIFLYVLFPTRTAQASTVRMKAFGTDPKGELFRKAHLALEESLAHAVPVISWDFASDGGWLQAAGVPCIGYGPGEMKVMHAIQESCSLDLLAEAVDGYALLATALDA